MSVIMDYNMNNSELKLLSLLNTSGLSPMSNDSTQIEVTFPGYHIAEDECD